MPYIPQKNRTDLIPQPKAYAEKPGELNYQITRLCDWYLTGTTPLDYDSINAVLGVLGEVQAEVRRRVLVPYEDRKLAENGDVFNEANIGVLRP